VLQNADPNWVWATWRKGFRHW